MTKSKAMEIEILDLHLNPNGGKRVRGFADVKIGEWIVREFRILVEWNDSLKVVPPRISWRGTDGKIKHKVTVSLPDGIKNQVNDLILRKFMEVIRSGEQQA